MPTLEWIGKDKVINHHQQVSFRVLERQYSYDQSGRHDEDKRSENMIIHGDNLDPRTSTRNWILLHERQRVSCKSMEYNNKMVNDVN